MKSGFVSVIGRTNSGKSSLINFLLGSKLTLVSHKQNATRRKINAIIMYEYNQIIFIDTPGLHKSTKKFNQALIENTFSSINDCDLMLFVASIFDDTSEYENFLKYLKDNNIKTKHILILNKIDLATHTQILSKIEEYNKFNNNFISLLPISSKQKTYKKTLLDELCKYIPEHPYFYDPVIISDTNEKNIFKEFILESLFENFSEELPYCCEVLIDKILEKPNMLKIYAQIITDSNSHKSILIGKNGASLVRFGKMARIKIEKFTGLKIVLKLFINVKKNWQNDDNFIKKIILNN